MNTVIPPEWTVPQIFHQRLGRTAGRQRAMAAEGHLLLILHDLPEPRRPGRGARLFWRDPAGRWHCASGTGEGIGPLFGLLDRFAAAIEKLEQRTDQAANAETYYDVLKTAAPIHRTITGMHRALQDAREMVPADRELIHARDRSGELERAAELLHADARNGLDYTIARRGEEQAAASHRLVQASHRLNLLAAVFLPLTALGAIFSMRLSHGLEDWAAPWMFWGLILLGLLTGLTLRGIINAPAERADRPKREPWKTGE